MDKIKDFFENLVENHLGVMIAAILVFVALIAGAIVLSLKINRRKKERAEREYKEELSRISKEELDNIAGNVSNPEVLYKSFETAETTENKPLKSEDNGEDKSEAASKEEPADTSKTVESDGNVSDKQVGGKKGGNDQDAKTHAKTAESENAAETAPAKTAAQAVSAEPAKQTAPAKAATSKTKPTAKPAQGKPTDNLAQQAVKPATNKTKPSAAKPKNPVAASANKTTGANETAGANKTTGANAPIATAKSAKTATEKKPADAHKQAYAGKWVIAKSEDGKYYAKLLASNGGVLLKTENYSSLSGAKNGIQTIKKNVDGGNFATSIDKYGHYCFKLFSMSNRLICQSEDYSSKAKCESGINSVKRFAKTDLIINEID